MAESDQRSGTRAVGVGIVGFGLAGSVFHAPVLSAIDDLRICAIVTSNDRRADQARKQYPGVVISPSVEHLLSVPDIELVVIASPNSTHHEFGIMALRDGRHVVVDKPMALDVRAADRLVDAAVASGSVLSIYHNRRWDGDFLTVRAQLSEGRIGSVDFFESRFEVWDPVVRATWRQDPAELGGVLFDIGTHLVDQALVLFGPVEQVFAQARARRHLAKVEDSAFVVLQHRGGVHSRLWMSMNARQQGSRFRLRGTDGEFSKDGLDPQEGQLKRGVRPRDAGYGRDARAAWGTLVDSAGMSMRIPTLPGNYVAFYEELALAIRGTARAPVDPSDAAEGLRVLAAAVRSARSGSVQRVGP